LILHIHSPRHKFSDILRIYRAYHMTAAFAGVKAPIMQNFINAQRTKNATTPSVVNVR
jgi:hypothetical protein